MMDIKIFNEKEKLFQETADFILQDIQKYIEEKGTCSIGLAGGSTYREIYEIISEYEDEVDWKNVHFFWGDERTVPITHEDSNVAMVYDTLLNEIPVPSQNTHVIHGEKEPEYAATLYERIISNHFKDSQGLDILLLGLGTDGHTASLFPDTSVLEENERPVSVVYVPKLKTYRITLTAPFLNKASTIIFVAMGPGKAKAVKEVIEGEENVKKYPAQMIKPIRGKIHWFLDSAAAEGLKQHT